ncbi:MAG: CBS domain-containing protein [Desulfurococcales archaeon]|nr:CBS domain-containing protein [Desulfurococcales archaeon]
MVRLPRRTIPLLARDIMSSPPVTVDEKTPLREVAKIMCEKKIGSVLVVGVDGKLRGIVTERDITCAARHEEDVCQLPVWQFMTESPISVYETTPISEVLEKFSEIGVRHLPVVDRDMKPVGVISIRDVLAVVELLFRAFK